MRKNGYSSALREFEQSLKRPALLRDLEKRQYKDPPRPDEIHAVEALRGAATVLMIATLERYLKDAVEEYVDELSRKALYTSHPKLPSVILESNDWNRLNYVVRFMRGPKPDKLVELRAAAQKVAAKGFIVESFSSTNSNPGPETVKTMLKDLGIGDPFTVVETNFAKHFKSPTAKGFVETTLAGIVARRNEVAHTGYALSISRADLATWLLFLRCFGKAVDNTLRDYTLSIIAVI